MDSDEPIGPTGRFPAGRVRHDDCGELTYRVGLSGENVFIDFAAPVEWVGMSPAAARDLAARLVKWADRVDDVQGNNRVN